MVLCAFLNIILLAVIITLIFGLGMLGGIPTWYKNIRENRINCDDIKYANDASKWNVQKEEPKDDMSKRAWNFAKYIQGNDPRFKQNIQTKATQCV